ncbi:phosphopantetheine adenylyltransferase [Campylobacter blaseri]|uniref:Phosphopantetheine adenylyltransferase n=1 Tax=Campylobacter blaseri TaxID=2042961 RepID=A0A2P8QYT6_9BACT|nr:pantetheine-phosphate adenylyltransferase [Campylobacter blaseri]PSM51418.1 pantetheine-phosphate adenylyltransferase [Campylobacter blaseri]PSM52867.1 pantetheine-phosphate adenylyltransferase [Campylobacter blaseri]QKF86172.1 phosphopantetheine adenylyltransferase [Campylobacter blaseri]
MRKACIYPGTFDPITNGHLDVIKRARTFFDKVVIAIAVNSTKNPFFDIDDRIKMVKKATIHLSNIEVVSFDNLLIDFAKKRNIPTIIRGLRAVSDFEYELQMGYANASLWDELETVYLMPSLKSAFISSSVVRSIFYHGGDISHLVPKEILPLPKFKKDKNVDHL